MEVKNLQIDDGEFGTIPCDLRFKNDGKKKPAVIFMHGFKSFKDWGFIPQVCKEFATSGAIALNFDFSENGIIDPEKQEYDPEIFRKQTVSKMIEDAGIVFNFVRMKINELSDDQFNGDIYITGHSLGAAVAVLAIKKFRLKAKKLAMWSPIANLDRHTERQKQEWVKNDYIDVKIQGTDQVLPLDLTYLTDKEILGDNAILEAIEKINIPKLIVHGQQDLTAKENEAKELAKAAGDNVELFVVENAGHTFGIEHPFLHVNPSLAEAIEKTIDFFELS